MDIKIKNYIKMTYLLPALIIYFSCILMGQGLSFTNLFDESTDEKLETRQKKRSTYSILNSGNKIGVQIGYNYILNGTPNLTSSLAVDLPYAKSASMTLNLGFEEIAINSFKDRNTNIIRSGLEILSASKVKDLKGNGQIQYLTMGGLFKFYVQSIWMGLGLSYYKFLDGSFNYEIPNNVLHLRYNIDDYADRFFGVFSFGYLSEIRENVFLAPELRGSYDILNTPALIIGSITVSLLFRL